LIVFALVNYANFALYKETKGNRFISLLGTILCFGASIVLVEHNLIYSPDSLVTSGIVIFSVVSFSIFYYKYRKQRGFSLSKFMDKRLEDAENL